MIGHFLEVAFVHEIMCLHVFRLVVVKQAFTNYERRNSAELCRGSIR